MKTARVDYIVVAGGTIHGHFHLSETAQAEAARLIRQGYRSASVYLLHSECTLPEITPVWSKVEFPKAEDTI
jgi:hypothetical protein